MFIKICTAVIPGLANLFAWFLVIIGKAKDYQNDNSQE